MSVASVSQQAWTTTAEQSHASRAHAIWSSLPLVARIAIAAAAVLLVTLIAYFVLVKPKNAEASRLQGELDNINGNLSSTQTAARDRDAQGKVVVADLFRLTQAMPDRPSVAEAAATLNALAERSGIRLDSITPQDPIDSTGFQIVPFDVTFQGSFFQLSEFLLQLRQLVIVRDGQLDSRGRLFTVDSITFAPGDKGFPSITSNLRIDAFVYGTAAAAAAPGTDTTSTTSTDSSSIPSGTPAA